MTNFVDLKKSKRIEAPTKGRFYQYVWSMTQHHCYVINFSFFIGDEFLSHRFVKDSHINKTAENNAIVPIT
jgi:hypothetical protein